MGSNNLLELHCGLMDRIETLEWSEFSLSRKRGRKVTYYISNCGRHSARCKLEAILNKQLVIVPYSAIVVRLTAPAFIECVAAGALFVVDVAALGLSANAK